MRGILAILFTIGMLSTSYGQWQTQLLQPYNTNSVFGKNVSINDNVIAFKHGETLLGRRVFIYSFRDNQWVRDQTLNNLPGYDRWVNKASVYDDNEVIYVARGIAYILGKDQYGGWAVVDSIVEEGASVVGFDAQTLCFAAPNKATTATLSKGIVYVYERQNNSWIKTQTLIFEDGISGEFFGDRVVVSNEWLAIRANRIINSYTDAENGRVVLFRKELGLWVQDQIITPTDSLEALSFGYAMALHGNTLIMAGDWSSRGHIYRYDESTGEWARTQEVLQGSVTIRCPALNDRYAAISDASGITIFRNDDDFWRKINLLEHPAPIWPGQNELYSVAIAGDTLVAGSPQNYNNAVVFTEFDPYPGINYSLASLEFGDVIIDSSLESSIVISNPANIVLSVDSITVTDPAFSPSSNTLIIPELSTETLSITFTPSDIDSLAGELIIYHTGKSEPDTIQLTGNGVDVVSTIVEDQLPKIYSLFQNYPNPFNPETTIRFSLPKATDVTLTIYTINGQLVRTLARNTYPAGEHQIGWDGKNKIGASAASGIYIYRIQAGDFQASRKMVLLQ